MESKKTQAIDRIVRQMMKTAGVPGVGLAVVEGDEGYTQGYGVKALGQEAKVGPGTLFAGASTTKAFTCVGIALLVDEGKMAWDDPVRKYLPQFRLADPHADALVTIRDLICHRTGLPRHDMLWARSPYSREEILRRIGFARPSATFREKYQYQNICYMVAGEAARAASGFESWEGFMRERVLKPLGMERTNLSERDAQTDPDHAEPHQRVKGKVQLSEWLNFDNVAPAGTMNSCPDEMIAWLRFQLSGGKLPDGERLLSESGLKETRTPHTIAPLDDDFMAKYPFAVQMAYCQGWMLWNYRDGSALLCHGGAINGFRAHVALVPGKRIGLALFANLGGPFVEPARNALLDLLLDLPPAQPVSWQEWLKKDLAKLTQEEKEEEKKRREQRKNRLPVPLPLERYAGVYEDPAYGVVTVEYAPDSKQLFLRWNALESPLRHQTYQTFITTTEQEGFQNREVRFRANATGDLISLQLFDSDFTRR